MARIDIAAIAAEVAKALKFQTVDQAPAVAVAPPVDDIKAKRLAGLEKARAVKKAKAAAAPAKAAPVKAAPPVVKAKAVAGDVTFTGHGQSVSGFTGVNKTGKAYKGIRITDRYGRSFVCDLAEYHILSSVIRSNADAEIRAWLKG